MNILQVYHIRKNVLRVSILITALILLAPLQAMAQCTTDAWTSVTGTPQPLGITTSPDGKKYEGSCGMTVDAVSVPSFVTSADPVDEGVFTARFYFLASALEISTGDVTLFTARDGSTVEVELRLRSSGSINYLVAFYRDGGILTEHAAPLVLQDTWYGVEVSWSAGAGVGTFGLSLDDYLKYSLSDLENDSAVINEVDLGIVNSAIATGDLVFDAFEMRRTGSVGLLTISEMFGISTRADTRTGHEIVIGGFIINGDTDKCVVVRGRGPSVGVPEGETRLADPVMSLYSGPDAIESNDNWGDSPEAQTLIDLGMNPSDDLDSAIYACLPPGAYTVLLSGVGGVTGIGIVEVFDADSGTPFLNAISTRSQVDIAHQVAIGGFIIDGDQPKQVLVLGRGPSVGVPEGVTRLSDPQITLYNSEGTPLVSNDNWGDADNAAEIEATGMAPGDSLDSAVLTTLDPGAYTAILSGVGGVTGVGIVEVVDVSGGVVTAQ